MADSSSTISAPTEIQASTDCTMTIIGTGIAMIIAVAIATVLILRKNP